MVDSNSSIPNLVEILKGQAGEAQRALGGTVANGWDGGLGPPRRSADFGYDPTPRERR